MGIMADLFKYLDYRHFLKDHYREQKEKKGSVFSFRSFARQAGLRSPNFLQLVMEGKRNLGPDGIKGFAKALDMATSVDPRVRGIPSTKGSL